MLTLSQYASTALLTPKSDDPAQAQSQAILKFLPLMIGWFSLNVPSGLGLYWLTNNLVTTASTLAIRASVNADMAVATPAATPAAAEPKPAGFGGSRPTVQTSVVDGTKVTIKPPGAMTRKERKAAGGDGVLDIETVDEAVDMAEVGAGVEADAGVAPPVSKTAAKKKKKAKKRKN